MNPARCGEETEACHLTMVIEHVSTQKGSVVCVVAGAHSEIHDSCFKIALSDSSSAF